MTEVLELPHFQISHPRVSSKSMRNLFPALAGYCRHNTRLIVAFNFRAQIAFIKFVGSHAAYDKVDALTVSQF
jgi:mRNA-degrading endonuclease HigB of HigAB toxin-antitoxin module